MVNKMSFNNVVIFGDSYSTFAGYIPDGYSVYYSESRTVGPDVRRVTETWWYRLMEETDSKLIHNNSWSGSPVCSTGYNNSDCSSSSSFIYRLDKLGAEGFWADKKVDTIFVFGGTNDSWANSPVGELMYSDWEKKDLYSVLPAFSYFLKRLREVFPESRIVCLINTELKEEITNGFVAASEHYDCEYVKFDRIDKISGHPTIKGMNDIKEQIMDKLCK